jgi:hypothetical protein
MSDMIHSEGISKEGFYVEKDEDARQYTKAFDGLAATAMSEAETLWQAGIPRMSGNSSSPV